jgi:hypothetical protein
MKHILDRYESNITNLWNDSEEACFLFRELSGGKSGKKTGMVHDDERPANILKPDGKDDLYIIDFEHSHYASMEGDKWAIKSVRDERPFRHIPRYDNDKEEFKLKTLSYKWNPDAAVLPDIMRSHANALVCICVSSMNDVDGYIEGNCKAFMRTLAEEGIQDALGIMEGDDTKDTQEALYRLHLIDRTIYRYRYLGDGPNNDGPSYQSKWDDYMGELLGIFLGENETKTS